MLRRFGHRLMKGSIKTSFRDVRNGAGNNQRDDVDYKAYKYFAWIITFLIVGSILGMEIISEIIVYLKNILE